MEMRTLGRTGLQVSRLGLGAAEIGLRLTLADTAQAAEVLNTALDAGVNYVDTAACYGVSEELIGRTIAHRRGEYTLATKCGHVTGGYQGEPWTAQTIRDSVDRSLVRMRTDRVDLMQLHSCDRATLERGEVVQACWKPGRQGRPASSATAATTRPRRGPSPAACSIPSRPASAWWINGPWSISSLRPKPGGWA